MHYDDNDCEHVSVNVSSSSERYPHFIGQFICALCLYNGESELLRRVDQLS